MNMNSFVIKEDESTLTSTTVVESVERGQKEGFPDVIKSTEMPSVTVSWDRLLWVCFILVFVLHGVLLMWNLHDTRHKQIQELHAKLRVYCFDDPSNPINTAERQHGAVCAEYNDRMAKIMAADLLHAWIAEHVEHFHEIVSYIPLYTYFHGEVGQAEFHAWVQSIRSIVSGYTLQLIGLGLFMVWFSSHRMMTHSPPTIVIHRDKQSV